MHGTVLVALNGRSYYYPPASEGYGQKRPRGYGREGLRTKSVRRATDRVPPPPRNRPLLKMKNKATRHFDDFFSCCLPGCFWFARLVCLLTPFDVSAKGVREGHFPVQSDWTLPDSRTAHVHAAGCDVQYLCPTNTAFELLFYLRSGFTFCFCSA